MFVMSKKKIGEVDRDGRRLAVAESALAEAGSLQILGSGLPNSTSIGWRRALHGNVENNRVRRPREAVCYGYAERRSEDRRYVTVAFGGGVRGSQKGMRVRLIQG